MNKSELDEVLSLHYLYVIGDRLGSRADLRGANLRGADLRGANLRDGDLQRADLQRAALRGANLRDGDLQRADLQHANLQDADLRDANLRGADLCSANLRGANLWDADLRDADLWSVNLQNANLQGADLRGTNLWGADLRHAALPFGETWEVYLSQIVPALLTAGGKTLGEILSTGCWECHSWNNCPMHVALGINSDQDGPLLLRPRIVEFVQFFDARLIPRPDFFLIRATPNMGIERDE